MRNIVATFCIFIYVSLASGQTVLLKQGGVTFPHNITEALETKVSADEVLQGSYYRLVQFDHLLTQEEQTSIHNLGITLLNYLPHQAYLASIPKGFLLKELLPYGAVGLHSLPAAYKLDPRLVGQDYPEWAVDGDFLLVGMKYHDDLSPEWVQTRLIELEYELIGLYDLNHLIYLRIPKKSLWKLAATPFVQYLEPINPPAVIEDTPGRTLHRSNFLNSQLPNGLKFDGEGVALAMGDDGFVGAHIDFKGRLNHSQLRAGSDGGHGDGVAGIMLGAGNLDPTMAGMATGAELYVLRGWDAVNNAPTLHQNNNVRLTSSSLGNGCNAGYTTFAQTADNHIYQNPGLIHIFSAGNSGRANCSYGAGTGWGTITGGNKAGKNVIAVANLFADDSREGSSSRGPTRDGRLKPEIAANGQNQRSTDENNTYQTFGGTSGAAPGISGVMAQLIQAYRSLNMNQDPPSALMKALMLNGADDKGNPGPDYSFGFGRVNARKSYEALTNRWYVFDTIAQNGIKLHNITVPANTVQLKVMIYWHDPAAAPMAGKILINDIDFGVTDPMFTSFQPLVLNPTPSVAALSAPAVPGRDTMNNMEQVVINSPMAGIYNVGVNGTAIPQGPQGYVMVYQLIPDQITVTYPIGGEGFVPGEQEWIRWDAPARPGAFRIEYSDDNGITWNNVATVQDTMRQYRWRIPNNVTGLARIRVTQAGQSAVSNQAFSIVETPRNLAITQVCSNYTRLVWDSVPGATGYEVFMLGATHMDSMGVTNQLTFDVMGTNPTVENWFAVRARNATGGLAGRRTLAVPSPDTLFQCAAKKPTAAFQRPGFICVNDPITLTDQSADGPNAWQWDIQPATFGFVGGTNAASQNPQVQFAAIDTYTIQLVVTNFAGTDTQTQTIVIDQGVPTAGFTPNGGGLGWQFINQSQFAFFYQWDFGDSNTSSLINPFHTYAQNGTYVVTLTATNDCGQSTSSQTIVVVRTDVTETLSGLQLRVSPNPGAGLFQLSAQGNSTNALDLHLHDLTGKVLKQISLPAFTNGYEATLDFRDLAAGMYYLQVKDGNTSTGLKLVVE
ncbi:MAG: S8 family serine peptidase [Bacteroidota bacterium]